jgi:hypothetical protein
MKMARTANSNTRKSGPVANGSRADRPEGRVPVDGNRDVLTVYNKDPSFMYRWVKDAGHTGSRVQRFINAGYDFVSKDSGVKVGQTNVYTVENIGSIVTQPAGEGEFLFLMSIPKEWYEEDQKAKSNEIDKTEAQIERKRDPNKKSDDGMYGETKISRSPII